MKRPLGSARLGVVVCLVVVMGGLVPAAPDAQVTPAPGPAYVSGEVLVRFRAGIDESRRGAVRARFAARRLRRLSAINIDHLRLPPGVDAVQAARSLRALGDVLDAQPNYIRRIAPAAPPDDPRWLDGTLWGVERIQADAAWNGFGPGVSTVIVADLDTGVAYTHPDLAANMWRNPGEVPGNGVDDDGNGHVDDVYGIDPANNDADPMDDHGHGTHTAGTVGAVANNATGVTGVANNVRILACKSLRADGSGSDAAAAACFNYVVAMKNRGENIRVTTNSWGAPRGSGVSSILRAAIDAAGQAGVLNVFAAGNDGTNNDTSPFDPASYSLASILAVAASDQADNRASFSNYGAASVDLAAPGVGIYSTVPGAGYGSKNGTSMATPHAAGAAAMLFAHVPALSVDEAKAALLAGVDVLPQWNGIVASGGRLNVYRALLEVLPGTSPTATLTLPLAGSSYTAPAAISLAATASDDGVVAKVDFYANGTLIGTDTSSPYAATWSGVAAGSYSLTAVATDDTGRTGTSAPVPVTVTPPSGESAAAVFIGVDATSQGNWRGKYRTDGHAVLGDVTAYPSYTTVQPSGHSFWTWSASPTSARALERVGGGRVAATWYDASTFSIDVHLTDNVAHVVALYLLDWDSVSRAQRIDVVDVASGAVLDSRTASGFNGGQYLVWSLRGHVRVDVVRTAGVNAVVAGLFFGPAGAPSAPSVSLTSPAPGAGFGAPATINLSATATDDGAVTHVAFYANGTLIGSDATSPYAATWTGVPAGSYSLTAVATDDGGQSATSPPVAIQVFPQGSGNTSAVFVGTDTTTQGNWRGRYGSDGSAVMGDTIAYPAYATVHASGQSFWTWNPAPPDTRALERVGGGRVAATWYDGTAFSIDVRFIDGTAHQMALYLLDWDTTSRAQRIDVIDAETGAVLDSRAAAGFAGGQYLVWSVRGHVRVDVVRTGGANAVVSGLFFDTTAQAGAPTVSLTSPAGGAVFTAPGTIGLSASAADDGAVTQVAFYANGTLIGTDPTSPYAATWTGVAAGSYSVTAVATDDDGQTATSTPVAIQVRPPPSGATSATFEGTDTVTQGNWRGLYGADGYAVLGDVIALPPYADVQPLGHAFWTWNPGPPEARALERVAGGRVAATWYSGTTFSIDVHLTDDAPHQMALYLLDWDTSSRAQRIDVIDVATGAVLDSQSASGFRDGHYLVWTIRGHVRLDVLRTGAMNAVVSGLFLDTPAPLPQTLQRRD